MIVINRLAGIWIFVCIYCLYSQLYAQVEVSIQIPPPNKFGVEDLWKLTLVNTTTGALRVFLKGTVTESKAGLIVTAVSKSFDLPSGTKIFTYSNYGELDPEFDFVNRDPRFKESINRGGGFPSGDYEICIYVFDEVSQTEISSDCIAQEIMLLAPPSLISPEDETEITIRNINFMWTPLVGVPGVSYQFKLVEIFGNQTTYEAIKNNNALYSSTVRQTLLSYPPQALQFEEGTNYAWQVQSVDQNGNPAGSNNGLSEVWSFTFNQKGGLTESKITRQQAIDIMIKKIIVSPTLDHDVTAFLGMNPLESGNVYHPFSYDDLEKRIENPVWFGWINDQPQAFFAHSTRYIFIDAVTGSYKIETYDWWPVVNGESLWMGDEELINPDVLIFSTIHLK
jgi:hypothetical protein